MLLIIKYASMSIFSFAFLLAPAHASNDVEIKSFSSWHTYVGSSPKTCYMASSPLTDRTENKRDGKIVSVDRGNGTALFVNFVTDKPNANGEISFTGGTYFFDADKPAEIKVDSSSFILLTDKVDASASGDEQRGWAWTDPNDDLKLVQILKAGSEAIVLSTSVRGTVSKDVFSLTGFTAAYNYLNTACK